jgi:hypothetical protein
MSFLSIDQRKASLKQMDSYLAMLDKDELALLLKLADIREMKKLHLEGRDRVALACEGDLDADALTTVDNVCRDRLVYGIPHYPVVITSGQKVTVKGVRP